MWHVYVRGNTAFVPDVARTEAGFFLDVEPVATVKLEDVSSLAAAINLVMAKGNPTVPTPSRAGFPRPVILKPSGVKNWNAFVERGACFTIFRGEGEIEIMETARNDAGEWVDAPSLNQKLPGDASATDIARCIAKRAVSRADLT
jgi:hypothetical protein